MSKTRIRFLLLFTLIIGNNPVKSQDYSWWNEKHNWDGVTHWSRYLVISPSYMGPNALPVPVLKNGTFSKNISLDLGLDGHISKGDKTTNLFTEVFIPLAAGRVGLNLNWIPVEYFRMDTITRDIRRARDYDGEGLSIGDILIGTYIQILKDREKLPDILLSINLRTATGSNLSAVRYTDSPGYHFDLSFGKKFLEKDSGIEYLKVYGMMGLYVYQTYYDDKYQNDALIFGTGINIGLRRMIIKNQFGGYAGYIGDGDKPMVYRLIIESNRDAIWNYKLMFQQGVHDFDYSTIRISTSISISHLLDNK